MSNRARSFNERVSYARQAFLRNEDSRAFDDCFEMNDGEYVVSALMRMSEEDVELKAAIENDLNAHGLALWRETAKSLAHVPTHDLSKKATAHRKLPLQPRLL